MVVIDKDYKGIISRGKLCILERNIDIRESVHVKVPLKVEGNFTVRGDLTTDYGLEVLGNQLIEGDEHIKLNHKVRGCQTTSGIQTVGGDQKIFGNQLIARTQYVAGDQTVNGVQNITKGKFVLGVQDIRGEMKLFDKESKFSIDMRIGEYEIILMSELIYINGEVLTPSEWLEFPQTKKTGLMSTTNDLNWLKQWRTFVLSTHLSLVIGHKEEEEF